ncbi:MAG TPA: antitoxin Xre/MbcA/ParS toxin-binding domain-containing protein [Mucilaginibacter sp.]|nr:antitoxin Xre/MbcA/ParS toxin-binding domain-containing protein [Mucilaginibacter sp.]
MTALEAKLLKGIPSRVDTSMTLGMIKSGEVGPQHLQAIKDLTLFNDEKISDWLDISVKTFRSYKKPHSIIKERIKEQAVMALSLIKHGIDVFGSKEAFTGWLGKENFFFDEKAPIEFMKTNSGIKFIDDRLTALEYGDNV